MDQMSKGVEVSELNAVEDSRTSSLSLITNDGNMRRLMELAKVMAESKVTVPKHLQNSPGDCMAIIIQATNWGMNPFAVAQKTHLVNGVLGYEAQLVNAVISASGAIVGGFEYEYRGDGNAMECRVGAVMRGKSSITWGEWLCVSSVTTKNSPLWKTNPKQQLGYLQVKNWGRLYAPGAILGVYTDDELDNVPREINPLKDDKATQSKPVYPDDQVIKNMPAWQKAIDSGKKSPDDIIATIETKYSMTIDQKQRIDALAADVLREPVTINQMGEHDEFLAEMEAAE